MKSPYAKGCLAVVLLIALGGGYLFWRFKTPPTVADDFTALSVEEQKRRRQDARQFEDEVQDRIRKIKNGDKSPFKLAASEERLNTLLQDRIHTDKFPIRNLRVGLGDGKLALQGVVPYKGAEVTATLSGEVTAANGKLLYKVDSLMLGGLFQAPDKWKEKVQEEVSKNLNKLLENQNVEITRAAVEDKQLIIEGTPR